MWQGPSSNPSESAHTFFDNKLSQYWGNGSMRTAAYNGKSCKYHFCTKYLKITFQIQNKLKL